MFSFNRRSIRKIIEDALKKAENYLAKIKKHLNKELGHQKTDEHFKNLFNELGGTKLGKVYMGDGVWLNADGSMFCED